MTREEKINLLNELLEIEEKLDIGNLTRAEKGEFRQWVETLEQEPVIDKIRAKIFKLEADCQLYVDEYPSCKQCTDNVFKTIYGILDKCKEET